MKMSERWPVSCLSMDGMDHPLKAKAKNCPLLPMLGRLMMIAVMLVATCASVHADAGEGQNLIANSGFDEAVSDGIPTGWEIQTARSEIARVSVDTTNSTTGRQSIRIDHRQPFYTRIEQLNIKVKPRTDYLVRFDCKVQNIRESTGSRGASLFIGNNGTLMSLLSRIQAESQPATPGWHTYSRVINTGSNQEIGICLTLHNAAGSVWFDNIQIMEMTPTLTQSLASERARQLIRPDLEAVRNLARETGNETVLARLKEIETSLATQSFPEAKDYTAGLPFFDLQAQLYELHGQMLQTKHPQKDLIISAVSPFARSSHLQASPTQINEPIKVIGLRNDVEQFALNFTNCSTSPVVVRSAVPAGVEMIVRRVVEVQSSIGMMDDALRRIYPDDKGQFSFEVPAGMTRQIWFEVTLDDQLGQKQVALEFQTDAKTFMQTIDLTVVDLAYPESMPLKTFSYVWPYARKITSGRIPQVAADLKKHHSNAWMNRRGQPLPGPVVENGQLVPEKMKWELVEKSLQDFPFQETFVYFIHENHLQYGPEIFRQWVREAVRGFAQRGIGYDKLLITCFDEPFSAEVKKIAEINKLIREADPKLRTFSNFHDALTKAEIKLLAESVDVIAPEYHQMTRANLSIIRQAGAELWAYRVQERSTLPEDVRLAFWKLHEAGVKGYSVWAYAEDKDGWNMPDGTSFYNMIYDGDKQDLTPSKRWEAWREGIEDFALLDQLKARSPTTYREIIGRSHMNNLATLRAEVLNALTGNH